MEVNKILVFLVINIALPTLDTFTDINLVCLQTANCTGELITVLSIIQLVTAQRLEKIKLSVVSPLTPRWPQHVFIYIIRRFSNLYT